MVQPDYRRRRRQCSIKVGGICCIEVGGMSVEKLSHSIHPSMILHLARLDDIFEKEENDQRDKPHDEAGLKTR